MPMNYYPSRAASPERQEELSQRPLHGVISTDDVAGLSSRNAARIAKAIAALGARYVCYQPTPRKES